jgi:hypothetical protein
LTVGPPVAPTPTPTATPAPVLSAPGLISPPSGARFQIGSTAAFGWSAVSGAAMYLLQVDDSPSFTTPLTSAQVTSGTQLSVGPLAQGDYSWRARAFDAAGNPGPWSTVRSFSVR